MRAVAVLLATLSAVAALAAPDPLVPVSEAYVTTTPAYTYILDRGPVLTEEGEVDQEYINLIAQGPPSLLESGDLTPGHPYFGPVCDLPAIRAGEQVPLEEFLQRYADRRVAIAQYTDAARAAGCDRVIAYICMMTTGGDPEERTGFWAFWDNWEAFEQFDIPPRPDSDPVNWQQRRPDGEPVIAYRRDHPPYAPMFRWTNCINNPAWRAYQQWVTEEAARIGIDGFFVDNAGTHHCYCEHCRRGFEEWLKSRYTEAEIAELFAGDLSMAPDWGAGTDLRTAETLLFWRASIHRFLGDVRRWGSAIRGEASSPFFVFPNGLHSRPFHIATSFRDCDLAMDENSFGELGTHPGQITQHIVAGMYDQHVNDNILAYKYATGAGFPCRTNLLCRAGYPRADEAALGANRNVGSLGVAEASAFGGGGCYLHRGPRGGDWLIPVRERWNAFFDRCAPDLTGKQPWGQVAIFAPVAPSYFNDRSTYAGTDNTLRTLLERKILADLVLENTFSAERLARYEAVVVPYVPIMTDAQVQTLIDYARSGGTLILIGDSVASRDGLGRERDPADVQALQTAAAMRTPGSVHPALAEGGPLAHLPTGSRNAGSLVRMAAYVDDPEAPTELLLHMVNYEVRLGMAHDEGGVVKDLALTVPLPEGTVAADQAVLKRPDGEDVPVAVSNADGRARVTVPELTIYGYLRIPLQRGEGQ